MRLPTYFPLFPTLRVLWSTFKRYRLQMGVLVLLGFLSAVLEGIGINAAVPLLSFLMQEGGATPADPISKGIASIFGFFSIPFTFRYLLFFILGLFLMRAAAVAGFGYIRARIAADFLSHESQRYFNLTLSASWPFLLKQKIGTLHNTLVRDLQRTRDLLESTSQSIQSLTGACMYLIVAINISPLITLATFGGGIVLLAVVRPLLVKTQGMGASLSLTEKGLAQFLDEHIIGMKAVKAAAAERPALEQGNIFIRGLRDISIRMALIRALSTSMFQPFMLVFVIVLFAIMYHTPGFSLLSFAAALYLIQKIFTYLESGQSSLHTIQELVPYARHVADYGMRAQTHKEEKSLGALPFAFTRELSFNNVSFKHEGVEEPVLSNISFSIKRGETVGLIGPSGAGKSSAADLLLRLLAPVGGRIEVDGVPIEHIAIADWRRHIGYVAQDIFLFNGSIEENIRFYRPELTTEEIHSAAKQANIFDFVMSLPDGFASTVGDRGVMLSGGQRQRVALARALAGNPEILILDEATSALDSESEHLIHESIRALHGRVTMLMIAHRLSTVAEADTILVLEGGALVERGSPKELLLNPDSYFSRHQGKVLESNRN